MDPINLFTQAAGGVLRGLRLSDQFQFRRTAAAQLGREPSLLYPTPRFVVACLSAQPENTESVACVWVARIVFD
jgi:hypothetical protein